MKSQETEGVWMGGTRGERDGAMSEMGEGD